MEIQTLSPAASSALEAELAVLSSQLLALALQVLLDTGAVLPGGLGEDERSTTSLWNGCGGRSNTRRCM